MEKYQDLFYGLFVCLWIGTYNTLALFITGVVIYGPSTVLPWARTYSIRVCQQIHDMYNDHLKGMNTSTTISDDPSSLRSWWSQQ